MGLIPAQGIFTKFSDKCSSVAPITRIVVTRVKPVVHMHVGSGQTMELSLGGFSFLPF